MRKGADVLSKWVGEAERQLRLLFEEAQKAQPAIIFFDEIDGLAPVSAFTMPLSKILSFCLHACTKCNLAIPCEQPASLKGTFFAWSLSTVQTVSSSGCYQNKPKRCNRQILLDAVDRCTSVSDLAVSAQRHCSLTAVLRQRCTTVQKDQVPKSRVFIPLNTIIHFLCLL